MSAKFTKGPWKRVRNIEDNKTRGIDGPQNECVVRWGGIARPESEEGQANAALMIAAPLLYEALEALHAVQNGPPLIRDAIVWQEAMDKAEAALRAARGEG